MFRARNGGNVGRRVVAEALAAHQPTAVVRNLARIRFTTKGE